MVIVPPIYRIYDFRFTIYDWPHSSEMVSVPQIFFLRSIIRFAQHFNNCITEITAVAVQKYEVYGRPANTG